MPREPAQRRTGYGSTSRHIGARGARTRQRILDESLLLFGERGFDEVTPEDVAARVGVSRATVYQYFDGKGDIFHELMAQCTSALDRLTRRLGPLSPDERGFENLRWWLGEWSWIHDRYATVFSQWAYVTHESGPTADLRDALDAHRDLIAKHLDKAGITDLDTRAIANLLPVLIIRVFFYRVGGLLEPLTEEEVIDGLAICLQLLLFPDTPTSEITDVALRPAVTSTSDPLVPQSRSRSSKLSERAAATAARLIDAACDSFGENGYYAATIDDVVARARCARGTFYKYFQNKTDLLAGVLERGYEELAPVLEQARNAALHGEEPRETVVCFLRDFLPWHRRYAGALRPGLNGVLSQSPTDVLARRLTAEILAAIEHLLRRAERDYPFSPQVGATIMFVMVGRALDGRPRTGQHDRKLANSLEFMEAVVDRSLLRIGSYG
jgi:AcrR family transcriptional regulator